MEYTDYYEVMGVARGATQDEIKRAYRKLARKYHPDVSQEADAEKQFKQVGEAYEVLKDPEKRAAYDQLGQHWQSGEQFRPPPDWQQGFGQSEQPFGRADASDFSDFFEHLFGAGYHPDSDAASRGRSRARDVHSRVQIDLRDAYVGATRTITLSRPEVGADGRVHERQSSLNVTIPKGIRQGQQIRLAGQGAAGPDGPGDLYLEVDFRPDPRFHVEGADVFMTLAVAPWEAALGATIELATPAGKLAIKIPPGTPSEHRLRLKGKGIPGKPPGNLIVQTQIVLPPASDGSAVQAYRQFENAFDFDPRQPGRTGK